MRAPIGCGAAIVPAARGGAVTPFARAEIAAIVPAARGGAVAPIARGEIAGSVPAARGGAVAPIARAEIGRWSALVVLAACGGAAAPVPSAHGPVVAGEARRVGPVETPGSERRCAPEQPPYEVPPSGRVPACQQPSAAIAAQTEQLLAPSFEVEHDGGKMHVAYPCDGLGPSSTIREIVLETGGGHAGSLHLWRATRGGAGDRFAVRALLYQGSSMAGPAPAMPIQIVDGEVQIRELELDAMRAGLSAEITEVFPPPPANTIGIGRFSTSSHDFHVLVRLVDGEHRVLERQYTGYAGSGNQAKYLGVNVAQGVLAPMLALRPTVGRALDADDRALFAARFVAAVPRFDDQFYWWVMESYVDAARFAGGPAAIPGLVGRLVLPDGADRSKVDARVNALDALARITGWDARAGDPVDVDAAARAYLAACR